MLQILIKTILKPNMSNNDRYNSSIYYKKSVQLQVVMKFLIRDFIKNKISKLEISH